MSDHDSSVKLLCTTQIVLDICICPSSRGVFEYLKTLNPKLYGYHRHYTYKAQKVDVGYVWFISNYDRGNFEHQVLNSCHEAGVDFGKLARAQGGGLHVTYRELRTTYHQRGEPYLKWNENFTELELIYPDESVPINDIVSVIIKAGHQDKINGDSMMELIRLGLPLERAEVLRPGMVAKYKADLDAILLRVIPVKDLVWLIKTYLQPGDVPSHNPSIT